MDGRWFVALLTVVLPAVLLGVTVWRFGTNPIAVLVLFGTMIAGAFYLLSYRESF
ncbi:MAG TPA: hypothetical protein VJS68_03580 [Thermoplasmata archaeon]|nr:hypothetical protein [Thermoplasmata archaeon]